MPGRNGGQLRRGGPNGGAGGRRPDRIRRMMQRDLEEVAPRLKHIAKGVSVRFVENGATEIFSPTPGEQTRAIELMHKIGMGETVPVSDVKARLRAQFRVLRDILPPEHAERVCRALIEVWR